VNPKISQTLPVSCMPPVSDTPRYLSDTYWWAYVHPAAVKVFERQWLVNAILWGNFARLRDLALNQLGGEAIQGRNLQVACVYGDLTQKIVDRLSRGATLDVVDVLPVQLQNLRRKLVVQPTVTMLQRDSSALGLPDGSYDQALLFFLLHEQPEDVRRRTVAEAIRVVKPGGRIVLVDYHCPRPWHPLYYLFRPVLALLEPYALDLWRAPLTHWIPEDAGVEVVSTGTYFGGLYQHLTLQKC